MIYTLKDKKDVIKHLSDFLLSEKVYKELGEPILYNPKNGFFVKIHKGEVVGFCAVELNRTSSKIKYMYVKDKYRGKGFFSEMLSHCESLISDIGIKKIVATSTAMAKDMYLKKGYKISKSYKNYHNIFKIIQ